MEEILRVYGYEVYNALYESKTRRDVLLFFNDNPMELSISYVSKKMHIDYTNIKGIITGEGSNYKKDRSLVDLGLVICKRLNSGKLVFYISQMGIKIAKILESSHQLQFGRKMATV